MNSTDRVILSKKSSVSSRKGERAYKVTKKEVQVTIAITWKSCTTFIMIFIIGTFERNIESNTTIGPEHDSHRNTCIDDLTDMGNDDSLTCNNFGYDHHITRPSRLT